MRRLLMYLQPYRWRVVAAVTVLLCSAAVELVVPWVTGLAIDRALPARDLTLLWQLGGVFAAAMIASFGLEAAQVVLTTTLGQHVMYDLRRQIFAHLQRLSLNFYDRTPLGRLMTRVTSDVEVLNELFSSGVVAVFGDVFTLVFIAVFMFVADWRLALVTFCVIPLVFLAAAAFRTRIRDAYRDLRIRLARINAFLQEHITGMSVVQLFGREADTARRFRQITNDHLEAHLRSVTYYALFFPVIEILTAVSLASAIAYGGSRILGGTASVGLLTAFIMYARRFYRPIQDLSEKYNMLQDAMASSERIFKLLDTPPAIDTAPETPQVSRLQRGEIEFRDVWFAYLSKKGSTELDGTDDSWDWVLRGVSFKAAPGERIAVVGHTGAGKTTLIGLLMRFYEPQRGEIFIDGVALRDIPVRELRARISLVLQDIFIFSRSVAYNIRLGREGISDAAVRAAAERVGAHAFIESLPQKYETPLGERGLSLSVGERQLLSFARALAFDPLILVLDEATSSVDSALEARIEAALDELMRGRTSVVIAHRLSTIQHADRILVMHHGQVIEGGTHGELLAAGGLYSRLYELQFARHPAVVRAPMSGKAAERV
ncbi:MAG TPA: ABC transporter ATP-binding protein [Longimicrobiales bacterium]|nr:ABC transporter ATP-binding protein [Longimicrobiales bacterium]